MRNRPGRGERHATMNETRERIDQLESEQRRQRELIEQLERQLRHREQSGATST